MRHLSRPSLSTVAAILVTTALFFGCGNGAGPQGVPDPLNQRRSLELVWSEEFDGTSLDAAKWNIETGYGPGDTGWGNDEWQNYTADAVAVEDGNLVITADCPSGTCGKRDGSITSARITTEGLFSQRYGRIEARIKVPTGEGMWPAFWMLGDSFDDVGWPRCGEIDIMEMHYLHSDDQTTQSAVHWWDESAPLGEEWTYTSGDISFPYSLGEDYHVFSIDWNESRILSMIDGQPFYTRSIDPDTMDELRESFFLILNIAVGGTLGGAPDATTEWPQRMYVDWIRVYGETGGDEVPPPAAGDTAGIYSETDYDTTLPFVDIIPSQTWLGGNTVNLDAESTGVTPAEGSVSFEADFEVDVSNWGGVQFDMDGADFTRYSTLVFSLNTAGFVGFDDMGVEIKDGSDNLTNLPVSGFTPTANGDWDTYEVPLSSFTLPDLTDVKYLGFFTPVDGGGNPIEGTLYFDDIHLSLSCSGVGEVLLPSATYPEDTASTLLTVTDECSAGSTVTVTLDDGVETINLDVDLDSGGYGAVQVNFGPTDDASDTIAIADGDTLTASYTDFNSNDATAVASVVGPGPLTLVGDDNGDGAVYLYATDAAETIDLEDGGVDYTAVDDWSSGATLNNDTSGDADYDPVFSVAPGTGWGGADAGAAAFTGFTGGFATNYETLHFKFKGTGYTSVFVKFANLDPGIQREYALTSVNSISLGNGWYEFSVRLSDFANLATATEMAILNFGAETFYLTDIYFE